MSSDRLSCSGCDHNTERIGDALGYCSHCKRGYRNKDEQDLHNDLYTNELSSARSAYAAAGYSLD